MKILLHIPHTSLKAPKSFYKSLLISKTEFRKYNLKMSDINIDYLFSDIKGKRIKPKYTRLYCDVEKFKDDSKEFMSRYGQGVIYTHTYDNILFHHHDDKYKKRVYKYYDKYHKKLDKTARRLLSKNNKLLILDIHSYSDELAICHHDVPFPDICIGIENDYYDKELLDYIINIINKKGYTYQINYPYTGSIIPNSIFNNPKYKNRVISIMLEVNKRIYL